MQSISFLIDIANIEQFSVRTMLFAENFTVNFKLVFIWLIRKALKIGSFSILNIWESDSGNLKLNVAFQMVTLIISESQSRQKNYSKSLYVVMT